MATLKEKVKNFFLYELNEDVQVSNWNAFCAKKKNQMRIYAIRACEIDELFYECSPYEVFEHLSECNFHHEYIGMYNGCFESFNKISEFQAFEEYEDVFLEWYFSVMNGYDIYDIIRDYFLFEKNPDLLTRFFENFSPELDMNDTDIEEAYQNFFFEGFERIYEEEVEYRRRCEDDNYCLLYLLRQFEPKSVMEEPTECFE